jgi:nitrate/nitrite transporter NarK
VVFGITATVLADRLQLSVIQSAMLSSTSLLFAACAAVPVSLATRVWGGRVITFVLLVVAGTAMLILAALLHWVVDLPSLYALFIVLGLFLGCGVVTVNSGLVHLSWWFPERSQGTVAGTFLFAFSLGPGVFGAFAAPAANAMSIGGLFLFWGLFIYCGAIVALFCFDPPYTQLLRIVRRKGLLVETLPGESSKNLVELSNSNVSQAQLMAVCKDVLGQEVFPENAFLRDLRFSLTRLENWCVIGIASLTLGVLLGYIVWIPSFFLGVMGTGAEESGYIVLVSKC